MVQQGAPRNQEIAQRPRGPTGTLPAAETTSPAGASMHQRRLRGSRSLWSRPAAGGPRPTPPPPAPRSVRGLTVPGASAPGRNSRGWPRRLASGHWGGPPNRTRVIALSRLTPRRISIVIAGTSRHDAADRARPPGRHARELCQESGKRLGQGHGSIEALPRRSGSGSVEALSYAGPNQGPSILHWEPGNTCYVQTPRRTS